MPRVFNILPSRFEDRRHEVIIRGLQRHGYSVVHGYGNPNPGDILATWTRFRGNKESQCERFEKQGGKVLVAEEGYIRKINGRKYFSLSWHDHCGAGTWVVGDTDRWGALGLPIFPYREGRENLQVIVTEQRSIGSKRMASPQNWHAQVAHTLRQKTKRPVIVRYHPKTRVNKAQAASQPDLEEQLKSAWAVVTYSSAMGVEALRQGVPVFVEAPSYILDGTVNRGLEKIDSPTLFDRLPAFQKMAWAQWSMEEIERGEPFDYLLRQ